MIQKLPSFMIRLMIGVVFLSEGLQKLIFPDALGKGRFLKLGIPMPGLLAIGVATLEIVCAALILLGLRIRFATIPLLAIMAGAIYFTKVPLFLQGGIWTTLHEGRVDFCMICGLLFLCLKNGAA